jgi:uncharacterized tellurite resistance protein B-like protein
MIATLKNLLDSLWLPAPADGADETHTLQLATAVMLVEVMRADGQRQPAEQQAVLDGLREQFGFDDLEAAQLSELASAQAGQATDLFAFTSQINALVDMPRKLRMLDLMWTVAYADGHLSPDERHIVWRIADLLHIPQGAYALARQRAERSVRPS